MKFKESFKIALVLLALLFTQVTFAQNYADVKVDELSDTQIKEMMQRATALGYTDEQLAQMAAAQGMSADEMHEVFAEWNKGELDSYLVEITRDILAFKDEDGQPLVDKILDTAMQKGTGKWTGTVALDLGIPLTLITESVYSRCLSALKNERVSASKILKKLSA